VVVRTPAQRVYCMTFLQSKKGRRQSLDSSIDREGSKDIEEMFQKRRDQRWSRKLSILAS
jgi:hypothetical protein